MADDLTDLAQRLDRLAAGLGGPAMSAIMTKLGVEAKKDATAAAQRNLGADARFSGWRKAGALTSGFEHVGPGSIEIVPRPRGPWIVATEGRRAGRKRSRKRGRVVGWGATKGKNTWSDATTDIEQATPDRALKLLSEYVGSIING